VRGAFAHAAANLEQPQTEGVELQMRESASGEPATEGIEEPVDGSMQGQAEGIGPEAVVTQAVGEAGPFQILDPELRLAPVDIERIERGRFVGAGGDDEAGIGSLEEGFRLVDDAALPVPRARLVDGLRGQPGGLAGGRPQGLGLLEERGGQGFEPRVGGQPNRRGDVVPLTELIDARQAIAAVGAQFDGQVGRGWRAPGRATQRWRRDWRARSLAAAAR
jgi:hypothetical protein